MDENPTPPPVSERYKVLESLGEGGQGKVYKAFDLQLQRYVALKRLLMNENSSQEQLRKEALTLAGLHHPNIVAIYDVASDEHGLFLVMELVEGEDLSKWLEGEALSLEDFQQLASQSLEALIAAHELKVLHRDIKPENLRISRLPGGRLTVKLLDFGLARASQNARRQTDDHGSVKGSIRYMAPEQLQHKPMDGRTDLYALGCVFYKVLSGRTAFNAETVEAIINAHIEHRLVPLEERAPDVPDTLAQWVMWLINRRPAERPESASVALSSLSFLFEDIKAGHVLNRAIESGTVSHASTSYVTMAHTLATQAAPIVPTIAEAETPAPSVKLASSQVSSDKKRSMLPIAAGVAVLVVGGLAAFLMPGGKNSETKPVAAAEPVKTTTAASADIPAPVETSTKDKPERVLSDYPPVEPTTSAGRPVLPMEARLMSRYIASDHLMRYGDLDKMKKKSDDVPAGPGLAISLWNDLIAAGGNRPLLVRERELDQSPRMEVLKEPELRGEIPVVAFNEGQLLRASLPLDAADKVYLDPAHDTSSKPGFTAIMAVRLRAMSEKRDNRIITLRRSGTDNSKRTSYHVSYTRDHHLRITTTIEGIDQESATTTETVPLDKLLIVTMLINQAEKSVRIFVRGPGGFITSSPAVALTTDVGAVDELSIGSKPVGETTSVAKDFIGDLAELILYRSALKVEMTGKIEASLASHYFAR
ncbi:MAG: protein kinase [Verrucomicrobia bacterium]|nr:protein kinase [Verrucomicrobiota bacterium]